MEGKILWNIEVREDFLEEVDQKKKKKQYCIGEEKAVRQHI